MEDSFATTASLISLVVAVLALFVGMYSASVAQRVATSDFQTAERVKSDTAQLVATLRLFMMKGVIYSQQEGSKRDDPRFPEFVDLRPDHAKIEEFLRSETAVAYYSFVSSRSKAARESGAKGEVWRVFFLHMAELTVLQDPWLAGKKAARIEKILDGLHANEFAEMSGYLSDIPKAIGTLFKEREHDVIIQVIVNGDEDYLSDDEFFDDFICYLRDEIKVDDPEVDLFWGAANNDLSLVKACAAKGANMQIRHTEIFRRYAKELSNFKERSGV